MYDNVRKMEAYMIGAGWRFVRPVRHGKMYKLNKKAIIIPRRLKPGSLRYIERQLQHKFSL